MKLDDIYDRKKRKFKTLIFPIFIFLSVMVVTFITGLSVGSPSFFAFSNFALGVCIIALIHDHWVLNSLVIPFPIVFSTIAFYDLYNGYYMMMVFHLTSFLISAILSRRKNTSFIIMLMSSVVYVCWIFAVETWLPGLNYNILFIFIPDPVLVAFALYVVFFIPSALTTAKNLSAKRSGVKIDCDGGICPL